MARSSCSSCPGTSRCVVVGLQYRHISAFDCAMCNCSLCKGQNPKHETDRGLRDEVGASFVVRVAFQACLTDYILIPCIPMHNPLEVSGLGFTPAVSWKPLRMRFAGTIPGEEELRAGSKRSQSSASSQPRSRADSGATWWHF